MVLYNREQVFSPRNLRFRTNHLEHEYEVLAAWQRISSQDGNENKHYRCF